MKLKKKDVKEKKWELSTHMNFLSFYKNEKEEGMLWNMNIHCLTRFSERLVAPIYSTVPTSSTRFTSPRFNSWCSFSWAFSQTIYGLSRAFALWVWIFRYNRAENFAIEGCNLNFSFTTKQSNAVPVPILRDCSLRIPSGQFWMLLGPNGCGKSTLLKVFSYHETQCYLLGGVTKKKRFCFLMITPWAWFCRFWLVSWIQRQDQCMWMSLKVLFSKIQIIRFSFSSFISNIILLC